MKCLIHSLKNAVPAALNQIPSLPLVSRMKNLSLYSFILFLAIGCSDDKLETKGFQVSEITQDNDGKKVVGLPIDSLELETRPRNVLKTFHPEHRLTPIFKVNYHPKTKKPFTGSNAFHTLWFSEYDAGNNWNNNFMPGFTALYGYNLVNIAHFNHKTQSEGRFFNKPVLIKTLYYPAFSNDTLNYQPVNRTYCMVSVYDEDTNKDGFINFKDLRRFYWFNLEGEKIEALVPAQTHSVMSSEYDAANDFMYVFARRDTNQNGQMESDEPIDIFWINLSDPTNRGKQYTAS